MSAILTNQFFMPLIVQKFGGTSVASIERIRNVAVIVKETITQGNEVVAIVSAMAGATNALISKCSEVSDLAQFSQLREYDAAVSSGEIITAALLALELDRIGVKSVSLQGWQVPIKTNSRVSNALVEAIETKKLYAFLKQGITPVITGFQGVTGDYDVTTLGKGGSDTTAALVAAALKADRCDIYTDVEGVYTADPRVVSNAAKLELLDSHEMLRLSSLGAKVLHPRAALAALKYGIDMQILSSFTVQSGTMIKNMANIEMEKGSIKAITSDTNILKIIIECSPIDVPSIINKISQNDLLYKSFRIDQEKLKIIANLTDQNKFSALLTDLKNQHLITKFTFSSDIATVSLVGYGINNNNDLMAKIFERLITNNIEVKSVDCNDIDITLTIKDVDVELATRSLHTLIV